MQSKVCLITGATSGIGEVTATELARRGARVIIVGRAAERCAQTIERIRAAAPGSAVESLTADLSSRADFARLADQLHECCPRLDVLVNNAGAMYRKAPRASMASR